MLFAGSGAETSLNPVGLPYQYTLYLPAIIIGLICGVAIVTMVAVLVMWTKKGLLFYEI